MQRSLQHFTVATLPRVAPLRPRGTVLGSVAESQAVNFTLNQLSYILFTVLLYLLSVRQKVAKNSAQNKISHNSLLLASRKRHPSVGCYLPLKAVRCHSGAPGLVRFSVMNKNNAAALQTGPRLFPECQRTLTVILTVPIIFNVTFCNRGANNGNSK